MYKRKLDDNSIFHYDAETDKAVIQTVSDVEPVLEANKKEMNEHRGGYESENFNKVGSVDIVVYRDWCKKRGISEREMWNNNQHLLDFLHDPDNAAFRTHPTFFKKI